MKPLLLAIALLSAVFLPESMSLFPRFRADVLHSLAWVNHAPLWIVVALFAVILLNHYLARREAKRK